MLERLVERQIEMITQLVDSVRKIADTRFEMIVQRALFRALWQPTTLGEELNILGNLPYENLGQFWSNGVVTNAAQGQVLAITPALRKGVYEIAFLVSAAEVDTVGGTLIAQWLPSRDVAAPKWQQHILPTQVEAGSFLGKFQLAVNDGEAFQIVNSTNTVLTGSISASVYLRKIL